MDYKYSVFIGRFQPLHNGHLMVLKQGLKIAQNLIVVVGSSRSASNIKNPWTFEQRKEMIRSCFTPEENRRIKILGVRDYYYNDHLWVADIQRQTSEFMRDGEPVALLGNYKDRSSYYLKYFPDWEFVPSDLTPELNATIVRETLFEKCEIHKGVPAPVSLWLRHWTFDQNPTWTPDGGPTLTPEFGKLQNEYQFIKGYKEQWKAAPFPPTFVTSDAVVVCSGHVLVVRRKFNPGQGMLALPGGFLRQGETMRSAALRELREETGIAVDKLILDSSIVAEKVFDYPDRSLRGRTITSAYFIKLRDGRLPEVKGNDDAAKAMWIPIVDAFQKENEFFEDHHAIIRHFVGGGL